MEALPTPTLTFFIRILKHELLARIGYDVVEFGANQCQQCLAVNHEFQTFLLYYFVKPVRLADVVHVVGETVAASLGKTHFHTYLQ